MMLESEPAAQPVILDTNIVLDTFVFNDPATKPLRQALEAGALQWIATAPMREELERVLTYPKITPRLAYYRLQAADVLAAFDRLVQPVAVAARAPVACKDPDDQKFIDLVVAHKAVVLSKDNAILCMKKRLLALDAKACNAMKYVAFLAASATTPVDP